jgi:hypothetical protein
MKPLTTPLLAAGNRGLVHVEPGGVEAPADWGSLKSPENDVGYQRTENFASGRPQFNRRCAYKVRHAWR